MTKRHTSQSHKQKTGQFFTKNADVILNGFEMHVKNKRVIDPFVGDGDLLRWAENNNCNSTIGYDIEPKMKNAIKNDSILHPPSFDNAIVVTNPPYLSKNKAKKGYKSAFDKWKQNDLYKCHLASLIEGNCQETIQIIPSNFLSESRDSIRSLFFKYFDVVKALYWTEPCFDDATTGICVLYMKRGWNKIQEFPLTIMPDNIEINVKLEPKYNYLYGKEFFDYISNINEIDILKTDIGMNPPNTNIVLSILEHGKWPFGVSYNEGEPIYCKPASFTTYQLTLSNLSLNEIQQKQVIDLFQEKLYFFKEKYHGLFLANYMGANQKILSRSYANKLLSISIKKVLENS